jgi:hypothetical protein
MAKKKDKFEENACEFKNETECEEELEEDGVEVDKTESEHFDESKDSYD